MEERQSFEEGAHRVLDRNLFLFLLDLEVKRARRYQNYICLLHLKLNTVMDEVSLQELETCHETLGDLLSVEMRDSDLLAPWGENQWLVLLPYADHQTGKKARSRFEETLRYFDFKKRGIDIAIDQWVFPGQWTNAVDLVHHVLSSGSDGKERGHG